MSTGPMFDHFWLFAGGVLLAPILGAGAVAAVVRRWAARKGWEVEGSGWSLAGVVLVLFVLVPVGGGAILGPLHGIPPGLGFARTLLFLLAVYAGPVLLGAFAFGRFLVGRLSPRNADAGSSARVVAVSRLWFVAVHLALFPALFALAIVAS